MEDTPASENPPKDFNKIDLSQLQGFSFGTQWTQDKTPATERRERADYPRREPGAPERRDRRGFRRPAGEAGPGYAGGGEPHEARDHAGDRGPRRDFRGPRREGGGPRSGGYQTRGEFQERGPYESPFFNVTFYPEDTSFNALAKTIRSSCRTIELFEIARTVVGKLDRFVVVLTRRASAAPAASKPADGTPAAKESTAVAKEPIYLSLPDGMPFDSEEAAVGHVLANHLDRFFELADVEIDPPKGNFLVINKCGVTGELLGPPNYHRYAHIVQQHHAAKLARMPFEAFRSRIETVRDPEVVNQWLEKMKKATRYTWKQGAKPAAAPAKSPDEPVAGLAAEAGGEAVPPAEPSPPEAAPALAFDNFEDARMHLLTQARDKIVRAVEHARFHGKLAEAMPPGEISRAIEGALERQRRFPLDTANALRGRLRREHFTIFKKGSKGVSYVCAVKRRFRVPGQTFADSISALIAFIEANPMVRAGALPVKFLGIAEPVAAKPAEAPPAEPVASAAEVPEEATPVEAAPAVAATEPAAPVAPEPVLTLEERARISRLQGDLRWLVTEGYVTEFIDGRLFAPPPVVEARKKEVEAEENDPENFPEVPVSNPPFGNAPASGSTEQPSETAQESLAPIESPPTDTVAAEPVPAVEPAIVPETPMQASEPAPAQPEAEATGGDQPVTVVEAALAATPPEVKPEAAPSETAPA